MPHEVSAKLVGKTINDVLDVMWCEEYEVIGMNILAMRPSNRLFEKYSIQIKSFLLVYGAVKTTINDQGVVWVYGKGH